MIRVFIADDHAVVREGIRALVNSEADMVVVGEAADGDEALARAPELAWEVMLLDLSMPGRAGLDVLVQLKMKLPERRIIVLTMHAEDRYAMRVLRAGADGYLTKGRSSDEILTAIRAVATEGKYLTPRLSAALLDALARGGGPPHESLTNRELDVLVMIGRGMTPSDVGAALDLGSSTVSTHLRRIKSKLGLQSNGELVQYALKEGLVDFAD